MLKVKILEAKYEATLISWGGGGGGDLPWGEYGYFLELHILAVFQITFKVRESVNFEGSISIGSLQIFLGHLFKQSLTVLRLRLKAISGPPNLFISGLF